MLSAKIENLFLQAMSMAHDVTPGIPCTCMGCNQWRQELRKAIAAELHAAKLME